MENKPPVSVLRCFSSDPTACAGGNCPSIFQLSNGSVIVQGSKIDEHQALPSLPEGEDRVMLSASDFAALLRFYENGSK